MECEGECRVSTLKIRNAEGVEVVFDRIQFGYEPAQSGVFVESRNGGAAGCPFELAPTPNLLLNLSMPPLTSPTPLTRDDLSLGLLDFAGEVEGIPASGIETALLTPVAADVFGDDPFLAYDLLVEFVSGTVIEGHVFTDTHCEELDLD